MAEPEGASSSEAFQFLKKIKIVPFSEVRTAQSNLSKGIELDIHLLASIAKKIERICVEKRLSALHAIFCGLEIPLFVLFDDQGFYRYFLNGSYSGKLEPKKFIESSFYNSNGDYENVHFLSKRYDDIVFLADEIFIGSCVHFEKINENLHGPVAVLVQHMVDIQQGKFLFVDSIEVEQ